MKTNGKFPQDWQIITFAAIVFFLALHGCTTTKQLHQVTSTEQTQAKTTEETETTNEAETKTNTKTTAETVINETCDTTIQLWPVIDGKKASQPVDVMVKFNRTINRKEFIDQDQQKNEQGTQNIDRKEILDQKSEVILKDKAVERTGLPWWVIGIVSLILLAGVAVLLWRMKVF